MLQSKKKRLKKVRPIRNTPKDRKFSIFPLAPTEILVTCHSQAKQNLTRTSICHCQANQNTKIWIIPIPKSKRKLKNTHSPLVKRLKEEGRNFHEKESTKKQYSNWKNLFIAKKPLAEMQLKWLKHMWNWDLPSATET